MAELREIIAHQRSKLCDADRNSSPKVVQALVKSAPQIFSLAFEKDDAKPVFDIVIGAGFSHVVSRDIKTGSRATSEEQLDFWPEHQRRYVREIGRDHVYVPSRGKYVALMPGMITAAEVAEAGAFLISHSRDTAKRGRALKRLAAAMLESKR